MILNTLSSKIIILIFLNFRIYLC